MSNSVMAAKKRRYAAAKSGQVDVEVCVIDALSTDSPKRLSALRAEVCASMAVKSFPEGRLTRALRKLQDDGLVYRPRRGYYQLVDAK